jgi:hypothetical protein
MSLITISSDFGRDNYLISVLKSILYREQHQVIDISHDNTMGNIYEVNFKLSAVLPYHNATSHHIILCGLFINRKKEILMTHTPHGFLFFTDNGFNHLLSIEHSQVRRLKVDQDFEYSLDHIFKTIAHAIQLIKQGAQWHEFTEGYETTVPMRQLNYVLKQDAITAQVIHIDRFQNVVVNLRKEDFEVARAGRNFQIIFYKYTIDKLSQNYSDAEESGMLCFFNHAGYLEIALRNENAADLLGFEVGANNNTYYSTITVRFL